MGGQTVQPPYKNAPRFASPFRFSQLPQLEPDIASDVRNAAFVLRLQQERPFPIPAFIPYFIPYFGSLKQALFAISGNKGNGLSIGN